MENRQVLRINLDQYDRTFIADFARRVSDSHAARQTKEGFNNPNVTRHRDDIIGFSAEYIVLKHLYLPFNDTVGRRDAGFDGVLPDGRTFDVKATKRWQRAPLRFRLPSITHFKADLMIACEFVDEFQVNIVGAIDRQTFCRISRKDRNEYGWYVFVEENDLFDFNAIIQPRSENERHQSKPRA